MTRRVRARTMMVVRLGLPMLFMTLAAAASGTGAQDVASQDPLPKAPGKETVELVCGACHEVDTAIGTRRSRADWQLMIDAMINRGAMATEPEFTEIFDYLSKYFGLVNVNKAEATEIATVLELQPPVAEAIVRYRSDHGDFKTVDDVKQVPGVDAKAVEERKQRVAFK